MKSIIKNSSILIIILLVGIGFTACNADKEDQIVLKTLDQYKADLSEIVSSQKVMVQNCVVGYNKDDFRSQTDYEETIGDYMAALLDAEAVLAKPDLTIADIMDANYSISAPGKKFMDNTWISDRRPIHELIIYCDTLRVHTPIGSDPGSASQAAHDQFLTAINVAKGVRSRTSTIARQVTEAVEELNPELDTFEAAIVK